MNQSGGGAARDEHCDGPPPGGDLLEPRAELTDRRMVGGAAFVVDGKIGRRGETSRGETVGRGITLPRE
jgi:hypothetical protein